MPGSFNLAISAFNLQLCNSTTNSLKNFRIVLYCGCFIIVCSASGFFFWPSVPSIVVDHADEATILNFQIMEASRR